MKRFASIAGTTTAGGAATIYTTNIPQGNVKKIRYVPDATNPLDAGADIVITEEASGGAILTKANIGAAAVEWSPRDATHAVADGSAALFAAAGAAVNDVAGPPVFESRIKIVIAQGGNALATGTFYFWID